MFEMKSFDRLLIIITMYNVYILHIHVYMYIFLKICSAFMALLRILITDSTFFST